MSHSPLPLCLHKSALYVCVSIAALQIGSQQLIKLNIRKATQLKSEQLFETPWIVAYQSPLSMEFSTQEHWSELPFPSPEDLPNPWIEPGFPILQADSLPSETAGKPKSGEKT